MNKKKLVSFFLFSLVFNSILVFAWSFDDSNEFGFNSIRPEQTIKQDTCIELLQTCANCTYVNITSVKYPNSSVILSNVEMTKSGTEYNHTFCDTDLLGTYLVNGFGDVDGVDTIFVYDFKVTPGGLEQTTAQATGSLGFLIIMIFLTIFFLFLGFYLSNNQYLWILGIFLIFVSVLLMVYDTWLGYEYHLLLTGMPNSNTPQIIFYIFMTALLAGVFTSLALLAIHWRKVFRYIKREIKRKEPSDEDVEDWDYEDWARGHDIKPAFR